MKLKINHIYRKSSGDRVMYVGLEEFEGQMLHQFKFIKKLCVTDWKSVSGYGQTDEQVATENYRLDRGATILYGKAYETN